MARILACTDGSTYGESIMDHAAWAAARMGGAAVRVLHVLDRAAADAPADRSGALGLDEQEALLAELAALDAARGRVALRRGRALLAAAEARLKAAGVAEVSLVQRHGSLVDTVLQFEAEADLLVVGKRGEDADFAVGHLGANLERVLRASIRPVLVAARAFRPIRRFAIAHDGGRAAQLAVDYAAGSAALEGLEGELLTVAADVASGRALLEAPAARLAQAGRTLRSTVLAGEAEAAIAAHVAEAGIDLLVMGAYGHGRLRNLILGSTTTALLRACRIPVLVFR
ncbi:universal stress protein [Falsiroseomonas selenitidurans]|uniref:Universal stress protein n=1 Tax=Falsiroseomonas selenitidurans TaxID=2716335 RepID=A0ABX1EAR0_9PROT|nr:universal stress protein [Falsiroseomonas selenitidurans]NKC32572.1 universal stress protein [Falsiroseomonas selenitidurans]